MSRALRAVLGVVAAASVGACSTPVAGHDDEPVTASPSGAEPAPARVDADTPDEEPAPQPERASGPDPAPDPKETAAAALTGRWTSDALCLQLFDNGDFELSLIGEAPKVMAMGRATLTATGPKSAAVELAVERIWKARFVGPCRRSHEPGHWAESESALGRALTPGKSTELRITRTSDDAIEVCGEACVTLKRDVPQLVARWRIEGLSDPAAPSATWDRGDLLEIRFDGASSHVWTGEEGTAHAMAYGSTTITSTGADTFDVTFTPRDVDASASLRLWGAPLRSGEPRSLSARRLPRERLEVCAAADDCATLERQFDAYHYELD